MKPKFNRLFWKDVTVTGTTIKMKPTKILIYLLFIKVFVVRIFKIIKDKIIC